MYVLYSHQCTNHTQLAMQIYKKKINQHTIVPFFSQNTDTHPLPFPFPSYRIHPLSPSQYPSCLPRDTAPLPLLGRSFFAHRTKKYPRIGKNR